MNVITKTDHHNINLKVKVRPERIFLPNITENM